MPNIPDPDDLLLEALISMVIADDDIDADELGTLAQEYAGLTGRALSVEHLEAHARARLVDPAVSYPQMLGEGLPEEDRARVLAAAFSIAAADGFVVEEEEEVLRRLSLLLDLPYDVYRRTVGGLMSSRPS